MSTIKKLLISLSAITVLTILIIFIYSFNRTFLNDEYLIGNTTGNIYNGGLFCESNGKIYFSNDNDDGSLYVMNSDTSNIKKIHDDKAAYINVDENYIYYLRANNTRENQTANVLMFSNTGIYRINHSGKKLKLISSNPGSFVTVKGNHVYYQNYDVEEGLYLYRNQTDGAFPRQLIKEAVIPSVFIDNRMYYTGVNENRNINYYDLSSFTSGTYIEGDFAYPIFFGQYIYYIDPSNNYTINRMNLDGTDRLVIVNERCSTFNITNSGKYLYYQVDDLDNSRIGRIDLMTMESEPLLDGHHKQIHVTNNYVFFKDFNNLNTYIMPADENVKIGTFNPPSLGEK
ncbi:MAG: DUF5050 domain-containing protein [Clostridiales bacterium]|nr:DUF5050 domain-containing protein [Clostridiales bacterium]